MKSLDFLKEGFVEDANEAHQDHEVQMARQECFHAAEHALALHKLLRNISEAQGLEGWVSSKITLANDYLRRVREYLEYELLTKDINDEAPALTIAEGQSEEERAESDRQMQDFLSKGGEIQQVRANRGPRRSGASLASHHIGGMGDARTGRRSQMRGLGSNPTGKLLVAKESEGVAEVKSGNSGLLELWKNHGKAFNLLDYYTNASGNRKQIQKYKQIIDQLESRCEAEFGSKVCAAMKNHTDAMANSWYGQSNRSGELRAAKLRKEFGINWNGQLNESEQGESEGNNLELYGLKIGDTVKTEINGVRVQGDVIDIFPDKMEVELLLRGPNAGKTVTVDVRDTEALSEQGVAEGAKCNHTMEGENCPVHGLKECGSYGKVEEMSAGSVATVVNPTAKNKSKVGTLFGGTYKQKKVKEAKQMTFPGENTKPPQRPGDQVQGTEKATKPNPFKHRLVGNE